MDENNYNDKRKIRQLVDKFKTKFSNESFYFVLFICICIVAITSVFVSKQNIKRYKSLKENTQVELNDKKKDIENIFSDYSTYDENDEVINNPIYQVNAKEDNKVYEADESLQNIKDEASKQKTKEKQAIEVVAADKSEKNQLKVLKTIIVPVVGTITKEFANDSLVYSKTLEQWCIHNGIDIQARQGNVVKAVLDGKVIDVNTNDELGITITIDHGQGIISKYSCLSTDKMVKKGQQVKKGDPISGVGKGIGFELVQGPHLHFELILNGEYVDPQKYLPDFINKKN